MKKNENKVSDYLGWAVRRLMLLVFDIFAVNAAYYMALVIRFYVGGEFRAIALDRYLPAFWKFAPYYTVLSVAVFLCFKLYNNHWKHAGLHDLNRIFVSNAITAAIHVVGTLLFVQRMPITYYIIGAVLQLMAIVGCRFSYRLVVVEINRLRHINSAKLNVMIVGVGESARILNNQIESDSNNVARPVCVFNYQDKSTGKLFNGLPILNDISKLEEHFSKYQIKCLIFADSLMPMEIRREIRSICKKNGVEVQDFSGYLTKDANRVSLRRLMEYARGPVEIKLEGEIQQYENGEQALMAYPGKYDVKKVYGSADRLGVEIASRTVVLNDTNEAWVKETENKSGAEISFF